MFGKKRKKIIEKTFKWRKVSEELPKTHAFENVLLANRRIGKKDLKEITTINPSCGIYHKQWTGFDREDVFVGDTGIIYSNQSGRYISENHALIGETKQDMPIEITHWSYVEEPPKAKD